MKRQILFTFLMLLAIVAKADDSGSCGENVTYTYVEATHTLTISGTGAMTDDMWPFLPWDNYETEIVQIVIEEGVTSIGERAFSNCAIETITLPRSLTKIGSSAFYGCPNLKRVTSMIMAPFAISAFNWSNVVLIVPQGTKSDYKSVSGWKDAVIFEEGETVYEKNYTDEQGIKYTLYQDDDGCYYNVTGHTEDLLAEIVISNNINGCLVKNVSSSACNDCTNLKKVTFSDGIKKIDFDAFRGCITLKEFVSMIQDPSKVSVYVPQEIYERAHLVVPVGTKCAYLEQYSWKYFYIFEMGETIVDYIRTTTDGQGLKYELRQDATTFYYDLTGHTDALPERVIIPETLNGVSVKAITGYVFKNCTSLKWLSIPKTITIMDSKGYLFEGCSDLTLALNLPNVEGWGNYDFISAVELGEDVKKIGYEGFRYCKNMVSVTFPVQMESIASEAFEGCTSLVSISLPKGIQSVDSQTFQGCTSLTTVTIAEGTTTIAYEAFQGCTNLQTISFPEGLKTIGESAFSGCENLQGITLPESLVHIGDYAFYGCNAIKTITIPKNVQMTYGNDSPFSGCTSLESLTIESENFGSWFNNLTSIKDVYLGKEVTNISSYSDSGFTGLTGLETISVDAGNKVFDSRDNCCAVIETASNTLLQGCNTTTIPESVTAIGDGAFSGMIGITELILPASITNIGINAFYGCTALQTINSYIEEPFDISAFDDETKSTATLRVPFLTSMSYNYCSGWNFINIKEMDGSTEDMAIIEFTDPVAKLICVSNWDINKDDEICVGEAKSVTDIGYLFYNMDSNNKTNLVSFEELKYFTNLKTIGESSFYGCTSLASITIPTSVTEIGSSAFADCSALKEIELPEGLTTIGQYAFYNSGLNTITIPSTVTSIGDYALAGNIIYCNLTAPISVGTLMSYASNVVLCVPEGCEQAFRETPGWKDFLIPDANIDNMDWTEGVVTVNVEEPGELRLALVELDEEEIKRLKILGKLNSEDIKLLMEGAGKIANLESLDISGVTFDYDGGCYYSKSEMYGDIWGYYQEEQYYLTEEEYVTHPSHGAFSHTSTTAYHSPYLAAVFMEKDYKHIVMPKNFKKAARKVLSNCKHLQSVEYPGGIDYVDEYAFAGCSILQAVTLAGTDTICAGAFSGCSMLQNVENISRVKGIGESAFKDCKLFTGDNGVLQLLQVDSIPSNAFNNCKMLSDIRLSDKLYFIGISAFQDCTSLSSIALPNSLKSLSSGAFAGCSTLENVTYSPELMELDYTCFRNTPFMDSLPVEGGIKYMGNIALSYATNSNVATTSPATLAFREGTTYIADIFIESFNVEYGKDYRNNVTQLNLPSTLLKIGKNAFSGSSITSLTLPDAIKEIGEEAFNKSKITKLTLPEDISNIGDYAFASTAISSLTYDLAEVSGKYIFESCKSLEKVTFGPKVQLLPDYIFEGCSALTVVKSEERTNGTPMDIGNSAFFGCNNLAKLTLPEDMVYIGDNAFRGCSSLKSFSTSESLETIGGGAFSGCVGLTSFTLNEGLKTIGDEAFYGCSNIADFKLPESLDSLGEYAFQDCAALTELTLPANITRLGYGFVSRCNNIIKLVSHIKEPPYNGPGQYNNDAGEILYVPDGCKPLYRKANAWMDFENIEELSGNDVTARNKLKVADSEVVSGKSTTLSVELTNDIKDFVAYQFDLIVPKGLTIPENANGNLDVTIGSRYSNSGQSVTVKKLAVNQYSKVNKYRFVYISLTNNITGTGGPLLTLNLQAANSLSAGNKKASLENILFTQSNGTENALDKVNFNIFVNVTGLLLGDANDDNKVTITDAVEVARYIFGNQPEKFNKTAADVNGDGIINISDILGIINIILKQNGGYSSRAYSLSSIMKKAME